MPFLRDFPPPPDFDRVLMQAIPDASARQQLTSWLRALQARMEEVSERLEEEG